MEVELKERGVMKKDKMSKTRSYIKDKLKQAGQLKKIAEKEIKEFKEMLEEIEK